MLPGYARRGEPSKESMVPGVLRGFRHFRLCTAPPDGTLMSLNNHIEYESGFVEATCTRDIPQWAADGTEVASDHLAPVEDCSCGIYGWYDPKKIDQGFGASNERVTGVVEVKGRVVMGTKGFRAQAVRIIAICLPPAGVTAKGKDGLDLLRAFDRACEKYDAVPVRSLAEMTELYPPEDVSSLLPQAKEVIPERPWGASPKGLYAHLLQQYTGFQTWAPAPGCRAYTDNMTEFEQIIQYERFPKRHVAVPSRIDITTWSDPHSTYMPDIRMEVKLDGKVDISPMPSDVIQHLLSSSARGRYKGITVVIQAVAPFHHPGILRRLADYAGQMCGLSGDLISDPGEPLRLEIQLS
jgi:hypothetical protein